MKRIQLIICVRSLSFFPLLSLTGVPVAVLNTDFPGHGDLDQIAQSFARSEQKAALTAELAQLQVGAPLPEQGKPGGMLLSNWFFFFAAETTVSHYADPVLAEAGVLLQRGFLYILRNPGLYWVRLAMYTILAFVLGTLYWRQPFTIPTIQDRISLLFFGAWLAKQRSHFSLATVAAFMVFMSIAVYHSVLAYCLCMTSPLLTNYASPVLLDKPVFVRERGSGSYGPRMVLLPPFLSLLTVR